MENIHPQWTEHLKPTNPSADVLVESIKDSKKGPKNA